MELSEEEKRIINLRYILRMLKDEHYSREEIITEIEHELKRYAVEPKETWLEKFGSNRKCSECNRYLFPAGRYCPHCGRPVRWDDD